MTDVQTAAITEQDGFFRGPVRAPRNLGAMVPTGGAGSIHDDAVAQKLGFRGGTIAGSVHMDQFVPVLVHAFGREWFETGSLSLGFVNATISGDDVIAMVQVPSRVSDVQVIARMERPDGTLVSEGTASVGTVDAPSHLYDADLRGGATGLRILEGVGPGTKIGPHDVTLKPERLRARIDAGGVTEVLEWYTGESPWGGAVANPSTMVQLLRNRGGDFGDNVGKAVGLFGAIELRHHGGPVRFGVPYTVEGEVVAVGESPKTEYVWYDTRAFDASGAVVASMRMQLRWMKASSPLYSQDG